MLHIGSQDFSGIWTSLSCLSLCCFNLKDFVPKLGWDITHWAVCGQTEKWLKWWCIFPLRRSRVFTAADEQATRRRPASSYQANLNIYEDPSGKTFAICWGRVSNNMLHLTLSSGRLITRATRRIREPRVMMGDICYQECGHWEDVWRNGKGWKTFGVTFGRRDGQIPVIFSVIEILFYQFEWPKRWGAFYIILLLSPWGFDGG
jgi:hypothetical protein